MSGVAEVFARESLTGDACRESAESRLLSDLEGADSDALEDEQVDSFIQEIFFSGACSKVRDVAFANADSWVDAGLISFKVARALAASTTQEVALIDSAPSETAWAEGLKQDNRLKVISLQDYLDDGSRRTVSDGSLMRLRNLMAGFEFSILNCGRLSQTTLRIAHVCEGLVLVLCAHRTRRLVLRSVREELRRSGINLLGVVLAGRRFPVPDGLYRRL
jgi:hypothetical protein